MWIDVSIFADLPVGSLGVSWYMSSRIEFVRFYLFVPMDSLRGGRQQLYQFGLRSNTGREVQRDRVGDRRHVRPVIPNNSGFSVSSNKGEQRRFDVVASCSKFPPSLITTYRCGPYSLTSPPLSLSPFYKHEVHGACPITSLPNRSY